MEIKMFFRLFVFQMKNGFFSLLAAFSVCAFVALKK